MALPTKPDSEESARSTRVNEGRPEQRIKHLDEFDTVDQGAGSEYACNQQFEDLWLGPKIAISLTFLVTRACSRPPSGMIVCGREGGIMA